jgi:hypothetical protein
MCHFEYQGTTGTQSEFKMLLYLIMLVLIDNSHF